jgi:collagenase-like PrtC family protease
MALESKLTLGALLYNWSPERIRDFYFRVADEAEIDRVYYGEVVCSKRLPLYNKFTEEILTRLKNAGKEVFLSSLALVENEREIKQLKKLLDNEHGFEVEINDLSLMPSLHGYKFAVGPYINIYNEGSACFFANAGARIITLPFELCRENIKTICQASKAEIELQVFGKAPLAISARCYHARNYGLTKDSCQFICGNDEDGMQVKTINQQKFLTINGTQTQSNSYINLIQEIDDLEKIGVTSHRISPHSGHFFDVVKCFKSLHKKTISTTEAATKIRQLYPNASFSNGFYYEKSGNNYIQNSA